MENTAPETSQLSPWQWVVLNLLPTIPALIQRATIPPILERLGLPSRYIDFVPLGILFELGFMLYLGKKLTGKLTSKGGRALARADPLVVVYCGFCNLSCLGIRRYGFAHSRGQLLA